MDKLRDIVNISITIFLLGFIGINVVRLVLIGLERSGIM